MSLNVNGLGNPIKRARVMTKIKKENKHVVFLQETHLSPQENEKLKKCGYRKVYYSSHVHSHKRGVAILILNSFTFEIIKEIKDKEGRYIIVKGKTSNSILTLVCIYAPPNSDKSFFKDLLDVIALEAEGVCICGGDLNIILNYDLDTTSQNRNKKCLTKYLNTTLEETGLVDVWRLLHPLQRDYTHYSIPHSVHSRIDYFLMQKEACYRVLDCKIGVADVSDHNAIFLTIQMDPLPKNTTWRLNVSILNNETIVNDIKQEIDTFIRENDNGEVNPLMLWDSMKAVLRGKLIAKTTYLKRIRMEKYTNLIKTLKELEQKFRTKKESSIQKQITEVKTQIEELLNQEVEKKARYLKQSYYEIGPKSAKLLARRLRKRQIDTAIYKIKNPTSHKVETKPEEIENIFRDYYQRLYSQEGTVDKQSIRDFLYSLDLPSIGEMQNKTITKEITLEELNKAVGRLKANKTPGSDGFPAEWYRTFQEKLNPILLRSFNWTLREGQVPPSWNDAIVSLIPKEGRERDDCANYRPISILNVDYKLYTSIIAKRLELFIADLIDEDQCGFIPGRQTHDSIRRTIHILHKINGNDSSAALISLDAEKAFDRVGWEFLYLTLERFGFNQDSIKTIKAIYHQPTARVKVNGSLSDRFHLNRGTRQGCGLSPTLFALYIEPLAQAIRQEEGIKGVIMGENEHKIGLFADDVMLYVRDLDTSLPKLLEVIRKFHEYSGYKLNITKTQLIHFNYVPSEEIKNMFKVHWKTKTIKYLGVNITRRPELLYSANYNPISDYLKKDLDRWSTYPLDFSSRIHVIKMNILPRLLYLFQALPLEIHTQQFAAWDRMVSRFIWGGKRARIRLSTLQLPRDRGGMALPNLMLYFQAAQLRPLCLWCDNSYTAKWKDIETYNPGCNVQTLLGEDGLTNTIRAKLNPIALFSLEIWFSIIKQSKLKNSHKMLRWIALDNSFKPGQYDSVFKDWIHRGLTAFSLIAKNDKVMSFQELKTRFDLKNTDLFRYLQVRDYYNKEIKAASSGEVTNPLIEVMCGAYQQKTTRIVSKLYHGLLKNLKCTTLYVKTKWEQEQNVTITEDEWYQMCSVLQMSTSSQQWREFNWKCLIRFFITPHIKSKQLRIQQACWRGCGSMDANHSHIFWTCSKIQPFWAIVSETLQKVLGYNIPKEFSVLYLGNIVEKVQEEDLYLTRILLTAARKSITRLWLKPDVPNLQQWTNIIQSIYIMEKLTYSIRLRVPDFIRRWRKWSTFCL